MTKGFRLNSGKKNTLATGHQRDTRGGKPKFEWRGWAIKYKGTTSKTKRRLGRKRGSPETKGNTCFWEQVEHKGKDGPGSLPQESPHPKEKKLCPTLTGNCP